MGQKMLLDYFDNNYKVINLVFENPAGQLAASVQVRCRKFFPVGSNHILFLYQVYYFSISSSLHQLKL